MNAAVINPLNMADTSPQQLVALLDRVSSGESVLFEMPAAAHDLMLQAVRLVNRHREWNGSEFVYRVIPPAEYQALAERLCEMVGAAGATAPQQRDEVAA